MINLIYSKIDRYTNSANLRRGYHDCEYIATFENGTENEQLAKMQEIQEDLAKNNMWAYKPEKIRDNVWRINYGFDSGD